jgi:hypothetical protein
MEAAKKRNGEENARRRRRELRFSTENLAREKTEQTEQTPNNPVLRLPMITEQLLTSEVATISVKREADNPFVMNSSTASWYSRRLKTRHRIQ